MTAVDGAAFEAALVAVAGVPSSEDTRTHAQRTGAALGEMARLVLDQGLAATRTGGFRPHLTIQVSYETLLAHVRAAQAADAAAAAAIVAGGTGDAAGPAAHRAARHGAAGRASAGAGTERAAAGAGTERAAAGAGTERAAAGAGTVGKGRGSGGAGVLPTIPAGFDPATLADGTPIPASVLARLACDAEVSRVIFGPASQVMDVGRDERLYTGAMRRAVIARDRHCAYPGCDRPPRFGEVHHVEHWVEHGGVTSVENGVLLCWHHHDVVHSQRLIIHRNHARGRWEFYRHDGAPIPHRSAAGAGGEPERDRIPHGVAPPGPEFGSGIGFGSGLGLGSGLGPGSGSVAADLGTTAGAGPASGDHEPLWAD